MVRCLSEVNTVKAPFVFFGIDFCGKKKNLLHYTRKRQKSQHPSAKNVEFEVFFLHFVPMDLDFTHLVVVFCGLFP